MAKIGLDSGLQGLGGGIAGVQLAEAAGEHIQQPKLLQVKIGNVKEEVYISDAVGLGLHPQQLLFFRLHGDRSHILGDVPKGQRGQSGQSLRGIRGFLPLVHDLEVGVGLFPGRMVPAGDIRLQPGLLRLLVLLSLGFGGQQTDLAESPGVAQHFPQQVRKVTGVRFLPQGIVDPGGLDIGQGVVAIEPAVQGGQTQNQTVGFLNFPAGKGHPFQLGQKGFPVQPPGKNVLNGRAQAVLHLSEFLLLGVADGQGDIGLENAVVYLQGNVLAQRLFQEGPLQRGFVGAGQILCQHLGGQHLFRLVMGAQQLGEDHVGLGILAGLDGIGNGLFSDHLLLNREIKVWGTVVVFAQVFPVYVAQNFVNVHFAVQEDSGIGGVVIPPVVGDELLVGQLGDALRVAAADEAVAAVREQQTHGLRLHQLADIGESTLHLAVYNAVVIGLGVLAVELIVPALLHEDLGLFVDGGAEHRVQIDLHQVVEIFVVAAAYRVDRLVRVGHGVQEGLHGALQQIHEGLPDGETPGAVEHAVLQNVEYAGVVLRQGLEGDGEGLVLVCPGEVQKLCLCLFVPHGVEVGVLGGNVFLLHQPKSGAQVALVCGAQPQQFFLHGVLLFLCTVCLVNKNI